MPFCATINDLVVPVQLKRDDGRTALAHLQVQVVLQAMLPYRTEPEASLNLPALQAWVLTWSERPAATLRTWLADLIDKCFEDARVHTVRATIQDLDTPNGGRFGVSLELERSVHALLRDA